jgi:hypothetical protein
MKEMLRGFSAETGIGSGRRTSGRLYSNWIQDDRVTARAFKAHGDIPHGDRGAEHEESVKDTAPDNRQ